MDEDICYIHNHVSSVFLAQVAAHTQAASKSQLHVVIRKMMFYCPKTTYKHHLHLNEEENRK